MASFLFVGPPGQLFGLCVKQNTGLKSLVWSSRGPIIFLSISSKGCFELPTAPSPEDRVFTTGKHLKIVAAKSSSMLHCYKQFSVNLNTFEQLCVSDGGKGSHSLFSFCARSHRRLWWFGSWQSVDFLLRGFKCLQHPSLDACAEKSFKKPVRRNKLW